VSCIAIAIAAVATVVGFRLLRRVIGTQSVRRLVVLNLLTFYLAGLFALVGGVGGSGFLLGSEVIVVTTAVACVIAQMRAFSKRAGAP